MKGTQVRNISTLTRVLAGIPLGRLLVSDMIPRGDGEGAVRLPIIQDFGVDTRSCSHASTVHTGKVCRNGSWRGGRPGQGRSQKAELLRWREGMKMWLSLVNRSCERQAVKMAREEWRNDESRGEEVESPPPKFCVLRSSLACLGIRTDRVGTITGLSVLYNDV